MPLASCHKDCEYKNQLTLSFRLLIFRSNELQLASSPETGWAEHMAGAQARSS